MSFLNNNEIKSMGFAFVGENVKISSKASFYNCKKISIGNNSRIDDFCVLSAGDSGIFIGNYVHIAVFSLIAGAGKVEFNDFSGLSSRTSIYSSSDDYSGNFLTNPTVPERYTNVVSGDVVLGKHVIIGSGSVILPNVKIGTGAAIGALSLVNKDCESFYIYSGVPAKKLKRRSSNLIELEKQLSIGSTR